MDLMDIDLGTLAYLAGRSANDAILKQLHEMGHKGVRMSHGYVIQQLVDGEPKVGELGELLGVTQQAASKQLVELESLGYVKRVPDRVDGRIRRAQLTSRGRRLVEDSQRLRRELDVHGNDEVKRALVSVLVATGGAEPVLKHRLAPSD